MSEEKPNQTSGTDNIMYDYPDGRLAKRLSQIFDFWEDMRKNDPKNFELIKEMGLRIDDKNRFVKWINNLSKGYRNE